jgi:hypothetical protein
VLLYGTHLSGRVSRSLNRRFLQMCSHYLVHPVACTPASGWEKGQVENQVGLVRERFFTPRLRVKSLEELNVWLLDKCVAYVKAHSHPEQTAQTIWQMFEAKHSISRRSLLATGAAGCCSYESGAGASFAALIVNRVDLIDVRIPLGLHISRHVPSVRVTVWPDQCS